MVELVQFDIKTAFLNGELDREIYILPPEGYQCNIDEVCLLKKSLYGLKQAPRQWNLKLNMLLEEYGLKRIASDNCIFVDVIGQPNIIVAIYVDDGICISKDSGKINHFIEYMKTKLELRIVNEQIFVGFQFKRYRNLKCMIVHQQKYINDIIKEFNMVNCNEFVIPASPSVKLSSNMDGQDNPLDSNSAYRKIIGSLMYICTKTRPDISFIVCKLAQFVEKPMVIHWKAAKKVIQYLKGTANYGICYSSNELNNVIEVFSDADFAGCSDKRRSTTGVVALLNRGSVVWTSHRQKCTATSTTESEYVACSVAAKDIIWLRNLMSELGYSQQQETILYCDNISAIRLINSNELLRRTRHIEVQYHYVREKLEEKKLNIKHVSGENQVADILTKSLSLAKFIQHRATLGISQID